MLKFPVGPNRNAPFLDTPFLSDHMVCETLQPDNLQCSRVGEMHCKASNEFPVLVELERVEMGGQPWVCGQPRRPVFWVLLLLRAGQLQLLLLDRLPIQ